jgi:flavin reductase (DIM6/NTAB) family NADH-FMN oxidoreductase RutF
MGMPYTTARFKEACHHRATAVAIITIAIPSFEEGEAGPIETARRRVQAAIITEHSAAFPAQDSDECYVSAILQTNKLPYQSLKKQRYFGLSYISRAQVEIAKDIYLARKNALSKVRWSDRHQIPYLEGSNAAVLCSFFGEVTLGPNVLVVGHVLDVIVGPQPHKPLVNYQRTFRSVDDDAIIVTHPRKGKNTRL